MKTERDRLKADNNSKKRKIDELEGNEGNVDAIKKKALTEKTHKLFNELNISSNNSEISNSKSAMEVEKNRNEIIKSEFSKLKDENNSGFYLNIGLGALSLGSLLLLGWVVMRQPTNFPEKDPKKEKEK